MDWDNEEPPTVADFGQEVDHVTSSFDFQASQGLTIDFDATLRSMMEQDIFERQPSHPDTHIDEEHQSLPTDFKGFSLNELDEYIPLPKSSEDQQQCEDKTLLIQIEQVAQNIQTDPLCNQAKASSAHPAKNAQSCLYGRLKEIFQKVKRQLSKKETRKLREIFSIKKQNKGIIAQILSPSGEFKDLVHSNLRNVYLEYQLAHPIAIWPVELMESVISDPDPNRNWWSSNGGLKRDQN